MFRGFAIFLICLIKVSAVLAETIDFSDRKLPFYNMFDISEHGFLCNLSPFQKQNVVWRPSKGKVNLGIKGPEYSGGEIQLRRPEFNSGRFEVRMKVPCTSGSVSGFFLFRYNPWQEIDVEILGAQSSMIQTSIVNNLGTKGDPNNMPLYTPKMFPLGFNACKDFHNYAFEWTPDAVNWYADGRLVDSRSGPDVVPQLPMKVISNAWLSCAPQWAGEVDPSALPAALEIQWIKITEIR